MRSARHRTEKREKRAEALTMSLMESPFLLSMNQLKNKYFFFHSISVFFSSFVFLSFSLLLNRSFPSPNIIVAGFPLLGLLLMIISRVAAEIFLSFLPIPRSC